MTASIPHLLRLSDLPAERAHRLTARAIALKTRWTPQYRPLAGRTLAMIFAKSSTRTRVSFEVGMFKLGGHALMLPTTQTQLGRSEPLADTARVLSRYCNAIMIRNDSQTDQEALAQCASIPVINALSDLHHPCQLLADMQTWTEHRGNPAGKVAAWIGDGNNVCNSWIEAAKLYNFQLRVSVPTPYQPDTEALAYAGDHIVRVDDPASAVEGADLVVTDTWASMGQETERDARLRVFEPFQVNAALMQRAKADAIFMHCLPAHRGEEVTEAVIDGSQSVVWDEAENRLWAQMALLEALIPAADDTTTP